MANHAHSMTLTVTQGPRRGQSYSWSQAAITIGREAGNDLALDDVHISRHHARLAWDGTRFFVQDLGSANGTFVNGLRLTAPHALQDGDLIGLGPTVQLSFRASPLAVSPDDTLPATPVGPRRTDTVESPAYVAPHPAVPPPVPIARPAKRRRRIVASIVVLLGLCLCLAAAAGYYFLWPRSESVPLVLLHSPRHGEQVAVGQAVTVQSVARDEDKVVRVELWVDDQLQEIQTSSLSGGTSPFPLLAYWQPASPGAHTLVARAFNTLGGRSQASVTVEAVQAADRDGDGRADEDDACPDEAGSSAGGCPDRDGDGWPDSDDACPDETGSPQGEGCPVPGDEDRDGDGLPDVEDACPDQAGPPPVGCPDADGDGLPDPDDACPGQPGWPERDGCPAPEDRDGDGTSDVDDACPDEAGLPQYAGCPDGDGDGLPDPDDACPSQPGLPAHGGCPDGDGDGVPDPDDACPDQPGLPGSAGCPGGETGDTDGDGVPNDTDLDPDQPGQPDHGGAPPPGEEEDSEEDPGNPWDGLDPLNMDDVRILTFVEFEALAFEVSGDYDDVHCYVSLAGGAVERHDFESLGARQWDIAARLGGQNGRQLVVPIDEPLQVQAHCSGVNAPSGEEGDRGGYSELGSFLMHHVPAEWDGHEIEVESTGGDPGHSFRARYRLCADACQPQPLAPPQLRLITINFPSGRPFYRGLGWQWDGDPADITAFRLYVNGNRARFMPRDWCSSRLPDNLWPACGERREFEMTAFHGTRQGLRLIVDEESSRSNTVVVEGPPCPRQVRVTFDELTTFHMGDDEWWADGNSVGPIYGVFGAGGSTADHLEFNASDGVRHGVRLRHTRAYPIQNIFDYIQDHGPGCRYRRCRDYSGPKVNWVVVELDPGDDLTFRGVIWDVDSGRDNADDVLLDVTYTIRADDIRSGEYTVSDDRRLIDLTVRVDVLSGGP